MEDIQTIWKYHCRDPASLRVLTHVATSGLHNSHARSLSTSHRKCYHKDILASLKCELIIEGFPWVKKIVNGILIYVPDYPTLHNRLKLVLTRCQDINLTTSKSKLQIGDTINFAGHTISKEGIYPDKNMLKAIRLASLASKEGDFSRERKKKNSDKLSLIMCGSKSLTDTQANYATVELEALAFLYACQKCNFYLRGLPEFKVQTDHSPLQGVFQRQMHSMDNARLLCIQEKLAKYSFTSVQISPDRSILPDYLIHESYR